MTSIYYIECPEECGAEVVVYQEPRAAHIHTGDCEKCGAHVRHGEDGPDD